MNNTLIAAEQLRHVLTTPTRGVLGLVDDLLVVARGHGLRIDWKADHCRVQFGEESSQHSIEVPLRKSVFRAALARIAVLCNQRMPNSVSPYNGQGELSIGSDPTTAMQVVFVNTPDVQSLELTPMRNEDVPAMPETASDGVAPKLAGTSNCRLDGGNLSEE